MTKKHQNPVWKALSDATRRQILDQLRKGDATTGDLCLLFPALTRYGVMKHLAILEQAGLLRIRREGKFRWNALNVTPIREVYERWVKPFEGHWAGGALNLKRQLEKTTNTQPGERQMSTQTMNRADVELEVDIAAACKEVWNALLNQVGDWWREDFYAIPGSHIKLEAFVGGRLFEEAENGNQGLWYTVTGLYPQQALELAGHLRPEFGGPATSLLKISLEDRGNATRLLLKDTIYGIIGEDMAKNVTEGWTLLLAEGLKPYIEKRSAVGG